MNTQELDNLFGKRSPEAQLEADTSALMFSFLAIIDRLMEERKMSKKALAAEIGTSAAYITQLFRGHKMINLETIVKMQTALGIKFDVKLEGAGVDVRKRNEKAFLEESVSEFEKPDFDNLWNMDCIQTSSCNPNLVA